jgi:GT2 family glycosyltransferase
MRTIPVSAVIPTKNRPAALSHAIASLLASSFVPNEFVIVDASDSEESAIAVRRLFDAITAGTGVIMQRALRAGAAAQRNQAVAQASNKYVLFCDDDIICEPDCIERLWAALAKDNEIGGANAMIMNQSYSRPGKLLRTVLAALGEPENGSYAGRIVGPAINFLPQDGTDMPATMPVQWLNTTCTLYRRDLLPDPPFDLFFTDYSLREDVALSLRVGARAKLVNVPAARIFHDSQPGQHKADLVALSRMDAVNRHYVMTAVMKKSGWADFAKLTLWECCQLAICALQQRGGSAFWKSLRGRLLGLRDIMRNRSVREGR